MPSRQKTIDFLESRAFKKSITDQLPDGKAKIALAIRDRLINHSELNAFGAPDLKGTSAFDICLFMLFLDVLDTDSKTEVMAGIFNVGQLSCKKWIKRLRSEAMADIEWVRPQESVRGNVGKFVVYSWGIFDSTVYSVFKPYAKMVLDNYKSHKAIEKLES
ncbi:hypothetical protein [Pseudomonas putida]|uniref:Uncharacterized protein n=1 Tax=Pseudomonas putida TaxID=303 RepID=A0A8I1JJJ7_PSEPU|nr:hypothetical protein [Pseudomonas putida]MBI6882445.1 hypothetical protein [Pseudomonas putida]